MFKVIRPLVVPLRKLKFSRSGFTLVELLVVISIIAILLSVALGPIMNGIKKGQQSRGLQTAHVISLAEFEYANDNNQSYPDTGGLGANGGTGAGAVCNCLVSGGYVSDPNIFYINGSTLETKYTGILNPPSILPSNCSWDFCGATGGGGVNPNAPDQLPLVWSYIAANEPTLTTPSVPAISVTVTANNPFGTGGLAICYKSNSASFITATPIGANATVVMIPANFPGWGARQRIAGRRVKEPRSKLRGISEVAVDRRATAP